jgi:hypothetical protein
MWIFLPFLVPAAYVYYQAGLDPERALENRLAYLVGIAMFIPALLVDALASLPFRVDSALFIVHFFRFFLTHSLLPVATCFVVLHFLLRLDQPRRLELAIHQLFGLFTLYFPYKCLMYAQLPDIWGMVFLPLFWLAILFLAEFCLSRYRQHVRRSIDPIDLAIALAPVALSFLIMALCNVFWFFAYPWWTYVPLALMVILPSIALRLRKYR